MIRSMNPPGRGFDLFRKFVGIGRFQLRRPAIVEDEPRQRVVCGQFLEYVLGRGRLAGRRLAHHRNTELAEQDFLQLLGRVEIEDRAGLRMRLGLQLQHPLG